MRRRCRRCSRRSLAVLPIGPTRLEAAPPRAVGAGVHGGGGSTAPRLQHGTPSAWQPTPEMPLCFNFRRRQRHRTRVGYGRGAGSMLHGQRSGGSKGLGIQRAARGTRRDMNLAKRRGRKRAPKRGPRTRLLCSLLGSRRTSQTPWGGNLRPPAHACEFPLRSVRPHCRRSGGGGRPSLAAVASRARRCMDSGSRRSRR
jgi:hypothetical protein